VFFDNLQVIHKPGPILEETHYYPFGLTMSGISSKAAGKLENKYKYNGYEFNSDFDINTYESFYRSHDPQLGRFWQPDPKPNFGESPYITMSNNPILYNDLLGDTVKYANGVGGDQACEMVQKYASQTIVNKKGKVVQNKNYNEAFANVISRLDGSVDNFVFNFDANAKEGLVSYDGTNVNVTIAEPGDAYGTKVGAEGILFEETKHAEQVLDGKSVFTSNGKGGFGSSNNLQNEIDAKTFAGQQLGVVTYYTDPSSGFNIPTQLGYMKSFAKTNDDRALFLATGASNLSVYGEGGKKGIANIGAAYPKLNLLPLNNALKVRTKNDAIFGYPR